MGWRVPGVVQGAWLPFTSHTISGTLYLAAAHVDGPWVVALSDAAHLPVPPSDIAGPGAVQLIVESLSQLHTTLNLIYHQALSPPSLLQTFQSATATLPRETEAERMRVERIGQDLFRARLLQVWNHTCPLPSANAVQELAALQQDRPTGRKRPFERITLTPRPSAWATSVYGKRPFHGVDNRLGEEARSQPTMSAPPSPMTEAALHEEREVRLPCRDPNRIRGIKATVPNHLRRDGR